MTVRLGVLVSGTGTGLQNFIDRIAARDLDASIQVVISSRPRVLALERARKARIPTEIIERRLYDSDEAFSAAITDVLQRANVDLVLCVGFLRKYLFPEQYKGRVLNVHPALLPKYGGQGMYGHHVHEAVLAAGETESGCTIHITDEEYDHGPIILQRAVPVLPDDTPDTLADRVQAAEREAYPEAVRIMMERLHF
jgi:formyltetrahydrofolate-dependent phosphoribosylglycinamide formyltransferase